VRPTHITKKEPTPYPLRIFGPTPSITPVANHRGVGGITLRLAIERGEIEAEHPLPDGPWVLNHRGLETGPALFGTNFASRTRNYLALSV
jgi:hypothetical protein